MMREVEAAPIRVLLIEDDEDDYLIARDLLVEIDPDGYRLIWAPDYESGLQQLAAGIADVCLLDHRLGAHTGLELLREARSRGITVPMIMLTGMADRQADVESMRAGASDYLLKAGLDAGMLERSIRYTLEERRRVLEREQLDEALRARIEAEAASRAKDEILAVVSHELRNPLSAVLGWAHVLLSLENPPPKLTRAARAIEYSALLQKQLIDDLLDVARSARGLLRLQGERIDLNALVAAVIDNVRLSADASGRSIQMHLSDNPCLVTGDPERLQQVMWNLLNNALKFTPPEGMIALEVRSDDQQAVIEVRDTGSGISPEFLPKVFDRFAQEAKGWQGRRSGLGLGLALVRTIVEAHGGSVAVHSEGKGKGATFTVRLPLRANDGAEAP
ncbi:MAG: hybrid sensor histidine kinase/response regulator [Burkholderiales bacterium]|nr:hybrid sensor histidine kinase/response regulator [Burkholderiales bacterium]